MKRIFLVLVSLGFLLFSLESRASNIQISNVKLTDQKPDQGTVIVQFDLAWDFSWKDRVHHNWDAAWVFVKSFDKYSKEWKHAYLSNPVGTPVAGPHGGYMAQPHEISGMCNVAFWSEFGTSNTDFGVKTSGVYIYRKQVGYGSNLIEGIRLQWDYVEDGYLAEDTLQVAVFGIEMVYVPEHQYILGDGVSPNSLHVAGKNLSIRTDVAGRKKDNMGNVVDEVGYTYNNIPIPDTFPMGIKAFYVMKHEISQHAYADFLNTLTIEQQEARAQCSPHAAKGTLAMIPPAYGNNPGQYRNYIRVRNSAIPATDDESATPAKFGHNITGVDVDTLWDMESNGGNIACNFISWNDGLAYLDWACLRPMSELEYEKACRGVKFIRGEMAWGERYGVALTWYNGKYFTNEGKSTEKAALQTANYIETGKAPWVMRVGAFTGDSTSRVESGATYYGVLNMSDNLWERCVNVSTAVGRGFIPTEGDGMLSESGESDVPLNLYTSDQCWPAIEGWGFRGFQVSNRTYAESRYIYPGEPERNPYTGFRGCRYAPAASKFEL